MTTTPDDPYICKCPTPPRAVRGCPAHRARYTAQQASTEPEPIEPIPLPALHLTAQDITCCMRPMKYQHAHTSWTGQQGTGTEHNTSTRTCTNCGATLTITTNTPS